MSVQDKGDARTALALLLARDSWDDKEAEPNAVGGRLKRCFDLLIALTTLVSFSPLFLIIAALIKLSDGGPILYRHRRLGHQSRPFACLKFRTMAQNADAVLSAYLESVPDAQREWRECQKLRTDPRVTELGVVLRQLSLDELPQLINVIRGEMSFVGPRPTLWTKSSSMDRKPSSIFERSRVSRELGRSAAATTPPTISASSLTRNTSRTGRCGGIS